MPGNGSADDIRDDSLVEDDELDGTSDIDENEVDDAAGVDQRPEAGKDGVDKVPPKDDIEIVVEEERTEIEARRQQDRPAADADGTLERPAREDEADQTYSKNVRDRIERERRIARDARSQAEAEKQARFSAEQRALGREKEAIVQTKAAVKIQIEATKKSLIKAKDDGKTQEEVDLQQLLNKLQGSEANLDNAERQLAQEEETLKRGVQEAAANPLADDWMRNNTWFKNKAFGEQTSIAIAIDRALANERIYAKNSPEYFEELDRRIKRRIPEVAKHSRSMQRGEQRRDKPAAEPREKPREPTGGVRRDAASADSAAPRRGTIVLKSADLANMRSFGLDPTNKEHQREYALNKMQGGKG